MKIFVSEQLSPHNIFILLSYPSLSFAFYDNIKAAQDLYNFVELYINVISAYSMGFSINIACP